MKKITKVTKSNFKLAIAKQLVDIQHEFYDMFDENPDAGFKQMLLYWRASTASILEVAGSKAGRMLKKDLEEFMGAICGE